jgi:hypothetical protein
MLSNHATSKPSRHTEIPATSAAEPAPPAIRPDDLIRGIEAARAAIHGSTRAVAR